MATWRSAVRIGFVFAVSLGLIGCPDLREVPDLDGATRAEAETALVSAGLVLGAVTEAHSATVAAGQVISQDPAAGARVAAGSAVSVVLSLGPETVAVPGVVDTSQSAAEAAIAAAGLSVGTVTQAHSDTIAAGQVISQDPAAGTQVAPGSSVDLVISLGPEGVDVPAVVGTTQASAEAAITAAGLIVGAITQEFSDTVAEGLVIRQSPSAGTPVSLGSPVNLVISAGNDCVVVPRITSKTARGGGNLLTPAGLALGSVGYAFDAGVATGLIVSQSPAEGACVVSGTAVNVVISKGAGLIEIDDIAELQKIGNDPAYPLTGNYVLATNIDASETAGWNGGLGFAPIGSSDHPFNGWLDGAGYTITGLTINRPAADFVGLFGKLGDYDADDQEAQVRNVSLAGGSIVGRDNVGALCGYGGNGLLQNCSSSAEVSGDDNVGGLGGSLAMEVLSCSTSGDVTGTNGGVGGLVGGAGRGNVNDCTASGAVSGVLSVGGLVGGNGAHLLRCSASGDVSGSSRYVGGLIGYNADAASTVTDSRATGTVTAGFEGGGLIGRNYGAGLVSRCSATGDVTCTAFGGAGGLVGYNFTSPISACFAGGSATNTSPWAGTGGLIGICGESTITDCYARGAASGADRVGGLIGDAANGTVSSTYARCYATGAVTSPGDKGGLIGIVDPFNLPTISGCFWDTQTSGLGASAGGIGLTTSAMLLEDTYTAAGWDFAATWDIQDGVSYPTLVGVTP